MDGRSEISTKGKGARVEGRATYGRIRRVQVNVDTSVRPKQTCKIAGGAQSALT